MCSKGPIHCPATTGSQQGKLYFLWKDVLFLLFYLFIYFFPKIPCSFLSNETKKHVHRHIIIMSEGCIGFITIFTTRRTMETLSRKFNPKMIIILTFNIVNLHYYQLRANTYKAGIFVMVHVQGILCKANIWFPELLRKSREAERRRG